MEFEKWMYDEKENVHFLDNENLNIKIIGNKIFFIFKKFDSRFEIDLDENMSKIEDIKNQCICSLKTILEEKLIQASETKLKAEEKIDKIKSCLYGL